MKTTLYLIQTAAGLPAIYACLRTGNNRDFLILSYQGKAADTTIFAPNTTWTQGRNLLYKYVRENNLIYDYYVFMDEDIIFRKTIKSPLRWRIHNAVTNQIATSKPIDNEKIQALGFASLEAACNSGDYAMVAMRYSVWQAAGENLAWTLQTLHWFDACCNAFSKRVFFADTILPYIEDYDVKSWWISQFILVIKAFHYYPDQIVQNNQFTAFNTQSNEYPRGNSDQEFAIQKECARDGIQYYVPYPANAAHVTTILPRVEVKPAHAMPSMARLHERVGINWCVKIAYGTHYLIAFVVCVSRLLRRFLCGLFKK